MPGYNIDTLTSLKAIEPPYLTNGLGMLVSENNAWYVYKVASSASVSGTDIVAPDTGVGRWFKCNNQNNLLNIVTEITGIGTTYIDARTSELALITLTANTTINFSNLRDGRFKVIVRRNGIGNALSGWDARIAWQSGSAYVFPGGFSANGTVIFDFIIIGAVIYCANITEFS
jgi:hypothetical protein